MTKPLTFSLMCGAAAIAMSAPALAQTAPATDAPTSAATDGSSAAIGGDIVVTAQKRSEKLSQVPLAVSAVSAASLEARGITDTKNLTQVSPSLTYQQGNNPSNSTFRIRGIGTAQFGQGTESSVSVVMDGVVMARQAQAFSDLADIERIEVLRGPQGTLFGKNATAGVISIITARPTKELSGKVSASIAEKGEYHVNGTVSGPISDAVRVRLSGFYNKDEGYTPNLTLKRNINGYESYGVRGKVEIELGALNLLATADYNKNNAECCQQIIVYSENATLNSLYAPVVPGPNNRAAVSNIPNGSVTKQQTNSLEANYDLGSATITSITAYQKYNFNNTVDADGINTSTPIFTGTNGIAQFDVNGGPIDLKQFSQEVRIASNGKNDLNYVLGAFYSDLDLFRGFVRRQTFCNATGLTIGAACPAANLFSRSGSHQATMQNSHFAVFGQADYRLVGGLKAIGGLRWQRETVAVQGAQATTPPFAGDTLLAGFPQTSGSNRAADNAVTGKAGLQYEFSQNAQAYATFTHGYKGQGYGTEFTQTFNKNELVRPETVNAYEIGFKGNTADRKLSFAVAAYLADYRNLQVQANRSDQTVSPAVFNFITTNAGKSRTKGVEVEATYRPIDGLSIAMSGAYTDAKFDATGQSCPIQNQAGFIRVIEGSTAPANTCFRYFTASGTQLSGSTQDIVGGILPITPKWRFTLEPRWETPVNDQLTGYVDVNLSYQSKVNFTLEQDPTQVQKAYATVDLRLGVRPEGKGISASIFVKNLTDQRYYTAMGTPSLFTSATVTPLNRTAFLPKGAFRYVGASVGYSF